MIRALFPAPLLSVLLAALWLVLNQSVSAGHLLLAVLVGWFVPVATRGLRPAQVRVRAPLVALRLSFVVLYDVIKSNFEVGHGLLLKRGEAPQGGFIVVPLDTRDGNVLAVLAVILTLAPGTIWSELALDRSSLLIHLFDATDSDEWIVKIKERYEKPLMEIFE